MQKLLCLSCILMSGTAMALDVPNGETLSNYTVRNGDPLTVEGSATNTIVDTYGKMTVQNGGKADTTTIGRRGTFTVTGAGSSATNTILNSSSQMNITNGATADIVKVNSSAKVYIGDLSSVDHATLYGGSLEVLSGGTADNTILNDGYMIVDAGGTAKNQIVNGGLFDVFAGGHVNGLTINGGETVFEGDATVDGTTTINPKGFVYLHGNTTFNDLEFNNGSLFSIYNGTFKNIIVNTLNGNGTIVMNSNVAQNQHDILKINDGIGSIGIALIDYSSTPVFKQDFKLIDGIARENFYLV